MRASITRSREGLQDSGSCGESRRTGPVGATPLRLSTETKDSERQRPSGEQASIQGSSLQRLELQEKGASNDFLLPSVADVVAHAARTWRVVPVKAHVEPSNLDRYAANRETLGGQT